MPDFFEQAFPAGMSYERTFKIWGWRSCSYHLILEEYGSPLIGSLMEDPLISFDVLSSAFKYGNRCFTEYPADMPDFFEQAFPAGMSYERTFKIWGWRSCSYHLILEEYGSPLIGSQKEDTSNFLWRTVVSVQIWKQMLHPIPCRHARLFRTSISCWNV